MGAPTEPEIKALIETLALEGFTGPQIQRRLEDAEDSAAHPIEHVPSLRSIQSIRREVLRSDTSGPWTMADGRPSEGGIVLDAMAEVSTKWCSGLPNVSKVEASWIVRIHHARPNTRAWKKWVLARVYSLASINEDYNTATSLDVLMAYQPWTSDAHYMRYSDAVSNRWVSPPMLFAPWPDRAFVPTTWGWFAMNDEPWIEELGSEELSNDVASKFGVIRPVSELRSIDGQEDNG